MDNSKEEMLKDALYVNYESFFEHFPSASSKASFSNLSNSLFMYLKSNMKECFTRKNNSRSNITENIGREELSAYLARYLMKLSIRKVADNETEKKLYFEIMRQKMCGTDERIVENILQNCLLGDSEMAFGINADDIAKIATSLYSENEIGDVVKEKEKQNALIQENMQADINRSYPNYGINNLKTYSHIVNLCRQEVLEGKQIKIQNDFFTQNDSCFERPRRSYEMNDEMFAVTDIGQKRNKQQDSVLMLYHPANSKYKMLVIADGMGGSVDGDKASQEIVKQMIPWFESLPTELMQEEYKYNLQSLWSEKIVDIHKDILEKAPKSGSTFVGAIIGEKSTVIASVGDSRCYAVGNDNELYQLTSDDNIAFSEWELKWRKVYQMKDGNVSQNDIQQRIFEKDLLRFRRDSNVVFGCIGGNVKRNPNVNFRIVPNNQYKTLMLFSDGVTDCLSDAQIMAITRDTDSKRLAEAIVNSALTNESVRPELSEYAQVYKNYISAGKDNTSAIIFENKEGEER